MFLVISCSSSNQAANGDTNKPNYFKCFKCRYLLQALQEDR